MDAAALKYWDTPLQVRNGLGIRLKLRLELWLVKKLHGMVGGPLGP